MTAPDSTTTTIGYNDLDQRTWTMNANGDSTHFAYDGYLLDAVTDSEGQVFGTTYNALGWPVTQTDPRSGTTDFAYDEAGNVMRTLNRMGDTLTFAYDSLNNLTRQTAGGDTISSTTTADGMIFRASNAVSTDSLEFDSEGRVTKQITKRGSRTYVLESAFDAEGSRNRLWMSVPTTISYDYRYTWNGEGRLAVLEDRTSGIEQTVLGYNDHRQLDSIAIAGMAQEFDYSGLHPQVRMEFSDTTIDDAFGYFVGLEQDTDRVANVRYGRSYDTLRAYTYDLVGQVERVEDSEAMVSDPDCEYDATYGWVCDPGPLEWAVITADTMAYDAVGNRTDSGAAIANGNRLTGFGAYTFTHDDEGRTSTKTKTGFTQTYYWSPASQLDSVTTVESGVTTVVRYTYDALGRRITRDGPGGFEEYIYDGANVVLILDDNQNVLNRIGYYPGVDRPFNMHVDGSTDIYYFAKDHTGSVTGLYAYDPVGSPARTVANQYRYDLWGMPQGTVTEAVDNPIRFKSRWWDEDTELYDFRNRWYDPEIGRFISEDPIGIAGGINVYRFVGNDPVGGWDPYGLFDQDDSGPCEEGEEGYWKFTPSLIADDLNGGGYWDWVECEEDAEGSEGTSNAIPFGLDDPGSPEWYAGRIARSEGNRTVNEIAGLLSTCGHSSQCVGVLVTSGLGASVLQSGSFRGALNWGFGPDSYLLRGGSWLNTGMRVRFGWSTHRGHRVLRVSGTWVEQMGRSRTLRTIFRIDNGHIRFLRGPRL